MIYFIFLLLIDTSKASNFSCETKLKNIKWPVECFLSLRVEPKNSKTENHRLLNQWCILNKKDLSLMQPPEALFSLEMPHECLEIALQTKRHHKRLKIFEGDFLKPLK